MRAFRGAGAGAAAVRHIKTNKQRNSMQTLFVAASSHALELQLVDANVSDSHHRDKAGENLHAGI